MLLQCNFDVNAANAFPRNGCAHDPNFERLKEENDRSTKWKEKAARKKLERLARMDGSRLQADAQFVLQRSMHCAMLIPSVMTAVSGGDAVQSSPDPIAEDPRKALVFEEGDDYAVSTMHSQILPWVNRSDARCSSQSRLQATLLANLSRCNKAHCTSASPHVPCSGP